MTIESTSKIVEMNGIECRLWEGVSEAGVPVHVFIPRVTPQTLEPAALAQFDTELREQKPPSPGAQWYPLRMIL
jgi:hypothetical protein